ncbi:helix-turn-helix transcriptional regulator [Actinoplanes sichuanensis]|uniref:Helix-turn-helix domain-containing protein n=1 Tax=Actinoplanes sichuanensis TaxID=512349 RepID=A0ABW4AAK7_9ACTN|nr:helix-turn-helix transcriptional regulator [Actinoplanes sichuanensis]BEL08564.1 helix-turn-helix transcriptional regulator [Actinoplanes sichuanensis]
MSASAESPMEVGPTIARHLVRQRLRELRESSELSPATVAELTGWSLSKLNRIESGDVTVQPLEVRALLRFYGVEDKDVVDTLAKLSQASRTRQWYSRYRLAGDFQRFVAFEHEAAVINIWQVLLMPGLLQTEEYAAAVTALSMRRSPGDRDVLAKVKLRMDRQKAFRERLGQPGAPRIVAVIDESVLHRPLGGPDVLRRQLDHLLALAEQRDIYTIGVTPLGLAHHSGVGGTFELLQFAGEHGDVLFVETAAGSDSLTTDDEQTGLFRTIFQDLLQYGLTGDDALAMIRERRAALPGA